MLQRLDRSPGVERDAGLLAERADRLQRAMHVRAGLHVHRDDVGAGLRERLEVGIAGRDHQVRVEHLFRMRSHRCNRAGPERDIRHEVPVHHVEMDPVRAGFIDRAHFLAELGEVGGKDGGGDAERAHDGARYHAAWGGATRRAKGFNIAGIR